MIGREGGEVKSDYTYRETLSVASYVSMVIHFQLPWNVSNVALTQQVTATLKLCDLIAKQARG